MLLVIFGAGASYDCASLYEANAIRNDEFRMPLAKHLFSNRRICQQAWTDYYQMQPLLAQLTFDNNDLAIEQRLQLLQSEVDYYPARLQQLMSIRYYINQIISDFQSTAERELIRHASNYAGLADQINRFRRDTGKVAFLTFNYDTLFDQYLPRYGSPMNSMDDYINHPHWKLFKPHGSINWGRKFTSPIPKNMDPLLQINEIIQMGDKVNVSKTYELASSEPKKRPHLFPAIAVPFESKYEFEFPDEHEKALQTVLGEVSHVLIIGWRAAEEGVLELFRRHLVNDLKILIVNPVEYDAKLAVNNLRRVGMRLDYMHIQSSFTRFVATRQGDEFFKSAFWT